MKNFEYIRKVSCFIVMIYLLIVNPTNVSDLSDLTSEFRETSTVIKLVF